MRRWGGYLAFVLVFATACGLLSWWQWARNTEAQAGIDRIERNYDDTPVALSAALPRLDSWSVEDEWRPVELRGRYLRGEQLLVRNRQLNGQPGWEVLVPFRLADGRVFVVDRGWLALGNRSDLPSSIPAAPRGEVTVVARLRKGEPQLPGQTAPRGQVSTIHLPTVAERVDRPIYTGAYGVLDRESPAPATRPQAAVRPEPDLGPHISYALQWIAFGILAFIGLGWAIRHDRRVARGDPAPVRKRKSDADLEDELLDARV
ncbi:MAG: SURF1 family protein [Micrococcales bacterium]|nr:SURF1 family protein [Micrococcales bacterium]